MGSVIPILALNAIPVFADVDPKTYNITAETIKAVLTNRTKAVIPVHFIGQSCVMEPILHLAKKHNIYIIEDCAQSYLSTCSGRLVGTMGDMGCFSLNDFKHITCGDGGFVISNNKDLISRARLFADKGYTRTGAVRNSVLFGLNYRISELQAAVASVQLKKLASIIERRRNFAMPKHLHGKSQQKGFLYLSLTSDCPSIFMIPSRINRSTGNHPVPMNVIFMAKTSLT
jgi:dTDP-4-amino-4,6-dideoxygalactose transaminase